MIYNKTLITTEIISASEYMTRSTILRKAGTSLKNVEFVPPKLGADHFGCFRVPLDTTKYRSPFKR